MSLHWTEYLRAIGPTVIALFVAYVAYQQWRTNKASLREKLFDRRLRVYELIHDYYSNMLASGDCDDKSLNLATRAYQQSAFIFDGTTRDAIEAFRKLGIDLQYYNKMIRAKPLDPNRNKWIDKEHEIFASLPDEFTKVYKEFEKHLSLPKS